MGRPIKKDIRDRIIESAENRFYRFGFSKVSIDEIVADAKTSKAAVYRFFSSKEELVKEVVVRLNLHINSNISEITGKGTLGFKEKIGEIIIFTSGLFQHISPQFMLDLQKSTPELWLEYKKMRLNRINTYYRGLFSEGINSGIVRKDIPLEFILFYYTKITEIAVTPSLQEELKYNQKKIYEFISTLFFEGIRC